MPRRQGCQIIVCFSKKSQKGMKRVRTQRPCDASVLYVSHLFVSSSHLTLQFYFCSKLPRTFVPEIDLPVCVKSRSSVRNSCCFAGLGPRGYAKKTGGVFIQYLFMLIHYLPNCFCSSCYQCKCLQSERILAIWRIAPQPQISACHAAAILIMPFLLANYRLFFYHFVPAGFVLRISENETRTKCTFLNIL
jgi:hypothetical protein